MKKQPFVTFVLSGVSLTDFGWKIPSPFSSLELTNSEISSMTSWTLNCTVSGDSDKQVNVASFEALLYSSAQAASSNPNTAGIPVSFNFGWLDDDGNVVEYLSYQGFSINFDVSVSGRYMNYTMKGYASTVVQSSMPVLRIPAITGIVQPSAIVESLAKSIKATSYYQLDIDHNDAPTLVNHNALTTSFNRYVRGTFAPTDDYDNFPGLLPLSKSYSGSRDAAGLKYPFKKLSQVMNNLKSSPLSNFLKQSNTDTTPQCSSFSYWVDEPTMNKPGVIHYKSNANLLTKQSGQVLQYGTADTNVLSISGSYNGVAYNMTDMNFTQLGFAVDGSGNTIMKGAEVVNSWSSSLADTFQTSNIINDVNALASQFSGDFSVEIPGSLKVYEVAQPISLIVLSGNTLSPISGIYNIVSVTHRLSNTFITTLKIQRLVMSSANTTASYQGIYVSGSSKYPRSSFTPTSNIKSPYSVDLGIMYPTFEHMQISL